MSKLQRRFTRGKNYIVTGPSKLKRQLRFAGWVKFENREMLVFYPARGASKTAPGNAA
jgi:hypothetical protein